MSNPLLLKVYDLVKYYQDGEVTTSVLDGIHFELPLGESLAILGSSGSGKTTLLQLLGGLDSFNRGEIILEGQAYSQLGAEAMTALRQEKLGFIYQFHHLLPELSALENVMMPLLIRKWRIIDAKQEAESILNQVGLSHRSQHKPSELSGGERQRVAVARAIIKRPALILADEPTGNLDRKTAGQVMDLIQRVVSDTQGALVLVTHDEAFARSMTQTLKIESGRFIN